ncbi:uncharacterized protein LOC116348033 [Contarinia nasturtii]|uniref:uncharacterized protein LOC116348033 n=1 Tax=Contarinia nasturtii TaxID=265458 RepID=UPI0012D4673A|nr:uncharacterized protein LOC116348033 [Contarinia nasturtii]
MKRFPGWINMSSKEKRMRQTTQIQKNRILRDHNTVPVERDSIVILSSDDEKATNKENSLVQTVPKQKSLSPSILNNRSQTQRKMHSDIEKTEKAKGDSEEFAHWKCIKCKSDDNFFYADECLSCGAERYSNVAIIISSDDDDCETNEKVQLYLYWGYTC